MCLQDDYQHPSTSLMMMRWSRCASSAYITYSHKSFIPLPRRCWLDRMRNWINHYLLHWRLYLFITADWFAVNTINLACTRSIYFALLKYPPKTEKLVPLVIIVMQSNQAKVHKLAAAGIRPISRNYSTRCSR